jgi:hypothetical protein
MPESDLRAMQNFVEHSLVPGEQEYLFTAYAIFTVQAGESKRPYTVTCTESRARNLPVSVVVIVTVGAATWGHGGAPHLVRGCSPTIQPPYRCYVVRMYAIKILIAWWVDPQRNHQTCFRRS